MPAIYSRVCAILFLLALCSTTAHALHEIDHRFTISGYVRDDAGEAQSGRDIAVKETGGDTLGKAKTGSSGFYSIRLHLHNSDVGKTLELSTGTQKQEVKVKFDPDNVKDERTVEINFGAERAEIPLWESPVFYGMAGAVMVAGGAYLFTQRRKRLKRESQGGKSRKKRKK